MTSHLSSEVDADSVTSSPRSDVHEFHPRVRFMCSFGGKILPRPHDNQLRYVGGDTRIVAVHRATTFSSLLSKLFKLSGTTNITVKYQLPNEDLDALISVTTDEDVENMIDEYDRLSQNQNPRSARLRLFLFPKGEDSRASSINSLLGGSANREHWFFDALNGGGSELERGRSEASSILSEMPDYLFGLDNSDENQPREPKSKTRMAPPDNVSASDPGSPAPVVTSPFCSTSSSPCVRSIPDLPPVKTKIDNPIQDLPPFKTKDNRVPVVESKENQVEAFVESGEPAITHMGGYPGNHMWNYIPDTQYPGHAVQSIPKPMPFYYVPGSVPPGSVPVQVQPMQIRAPYVQQYQVPSGQVPVGYHQPVPGMGQVYGGGGGIRPVAALDPYDMSARVVSDGVNQPVYYGVRNAGVVPAGYPGMMMGVGEELQGTGGEGKPSRVSQSS